MNSKASHQDTQHEKKLRDFLVTRLHSVGGSIPFQHITGHFSQLDPEIRSSLGTSPADLKQFLERHQNVFSIDKNRIVRLVNSSTANNSEYDYDSDSSNQSHLNLPLKIVQGKGVVIKVLPSYGFIKSKEPVKTEIFFCPINFGDRNIDLTSFLYIGNVVYFNAVREPVDKFKSKYKATKVWKADDSGPDGNAVVPKHRKTRDTGLYDPMNLDDEGIIQNVFPNLGFIAVRGDPQNTVFFYKNRVVQYDNVVDLTKIFSKGDRVEFKSHRSTKADSKARWEATRVWKVSGKIQQDTSSKSEGSQHSNQSSQPKGRAISQSNLSSTEMRLNSREMKRDHPGTICPRSRGAIIKFDENELADGDSAVYYIAGAQVTDIGWEFSEGDKVHFDAVKIKSAPGWKATLVWQGKKPDIVLPTTLGDFTEFTDEENEEVYTPKSTSYVSGSSSSSLKSVSLKSDISASKNKEPTKRKTPKESNFENLSSKASNKSSKKLNQHFGSSQESLNSLPNLKSDVSASKNKEPTKRKTPKESNFENLSSKVSNKSSKKLNQNFGSSQESLNSLPNSKQLRKVGRKNVPDKFVNKGVTNWGDSPYPDNEEYECDLTSNLSDMPEETANISTVETVISNTENIDLSTCESSEEEVYEELNDEGSTATENENIEKDCLSKKPAVIKVFPNTEGEIKKVYSKFAEVRSSNLKNIVSFFWSDFYSDGMSVEQLKLEDLKQVLKIGDVIHFNYFIVVDDSGQSWQKVTLAWQGRKPKNAPEMSPGDFIKQNNLSVTITDDLIEEETKDNTSNRKFLTLLADDTTPIDKDVDKLSKTESYSEESLTFLAESLPSEKSILPFDLKNMSDIVYKVLKKNVFSFETEVNLNAVSEEIVNSILKGCDTKKMNQELCNVLSTEENAQKFSCDVCSKCEEKNTNLNSTAVNKTDSEAQTIITGDIIAQNIFTEC